MGTEVTEEAEKMYADLENDEEGFEKGEVMGGREMGVTTGGKISDCGEETGEKSVVAITDKAWLMGRRKEKKGN